MRAFASLGRSVVVALCGFASVSGCGDSGKGGETGPIPAEKAPAAFGDALCRLMLEQCDCSLAQMVFGSLDFCSSAYASELATYFAEAQAAGLEYHPECMGEFIDFYTQTIACSTQSQLTGDVLTQLQVPPCKVHSGSAVAGEACMPYYQALGDSCAQGLQCIGGTCMEIPAPPVPKLEGEVCDWQTDLCEAGTGCFVTEANPMGPPTCVRGPKAGEPCSGFCDVGLRCDIPAGGTDRVCLPPPGEGEECAFPPYECAEGLRCDGFMCIVGLPEGAECQGDDSCAVGLECGESEGVSDVCQPEEAFVCF